MLLTPWRYVKLLVRPSEKLVSVLYDVRSRKVNMSLRSGSGDQEESFDSKPMLLTSSKSG